MFYKKKRHASDLWKSIQLTVVYTLYSPRSSQAIYWQNSRTPYFLVDLLDTCLGRV